MWGYLVNALWIAAFTWVPRLLGKALVFFGIGYTAYTGLDALVGNIETTITGLYDGVPAAALAIAKIGGLIQVINIFLASHAAAVTIKIGTTLAGRWSTRPATFKA